MLKVMKKLEVGSVTSLMIFLQHVCQSAVGVTLPDPFPRVRYEEAMSKYGSDKPDLRYPLQLVDVSATSIKDSPLVGNILSFFTDRKEKFLSTRGSCEMLAAHTPIDTPYVVSLPIPNLRSSASNKEIEDLISRAKKAAGVLVFPPLLTFTNSSHPFIRNRFQFAISFNVA